MPFRFLDWIVHVWTPDCSRSKLQMLLDWQSCWYGKKRTPLSISVHLTCNRSQAGASGGADDSDYAVPIPWGVAWWLQFCCCIFFRLLMKQCRSPQSIVSSLVATDKAVYFASKKKNPHSNTHAFEAILEVSDAGTSISRQMGPSYHF